MKPAEEKARKEWLHSMHLRPVYLIEPDGGMQVATTGELKVYVAVGNEGPRGRTKDALWLHPVDSRKFSSRPVRYQDRGCVFPYDDIEMATEVCFKSKIAERIEELRQIYGSWKEV